MRSCHIFKTINQSKRNIKCLSSEYFIPVWLFQQRFQHNPSCATAKPNYTTILYDTGLNCAAWPCFVSKMFILKDHRLSLTPESPHKHTHSMLQKRKNKQNKTSTKPVYPVGIIPCWYQHVQPGQNPYQHQYTQPVPDHNTSQWKCNHLLDLLLCIFCFSKNPSTWPQTV